MNEQREWHPPNEDEEDEELEEIAYKSTKDALLFAIDVSKSMVTPPDDQNDTPALAALKCAYTLMQQRIISHPNDMIGVLLYGTQETRFRDEEHSRGGLSYPHCYLLNDLDIPSADDVKALRGLVREEEASQKLLVPFSEPVSMANVLFCANQIFTTKAPNFQSRRLFIVTDNDDPHGNDRAVKSSATVRAKDLYDLGVTIDLFPISRPDHEFDQSKFYNDIIYSATPTDPEAPAPISSAKPPSSSSSSSTKDGISLLQSLLSSINSKAVARRALFSTVPLEIGPGLKIGVKGYIMFKRQEAKRSCYIWLEGEKPLIATAATTQLAEDTARTVEKVEIKKAYRFGGEQVTFTPDEISALRHFGDPGIRIIGFKPASMIPIWANERPSTFLYPSEDDFVGSTRVFSALQQKLLKDDKVGIVWFVARKNSTPVIAALFPGAEKSDESGAQITPPGMWLSPLPYADDIRQNPETTHIVAPDILIDRMREVVQQLQLPKAQYDPSRYPNPALQWHYRILQAMALEEDIPEKPEDKTVPKYRQIDKRAGPYVLDWGHELHRQHQEWQASSGLATSILTKRPAPHPDSRENEVKRARIGSGQDDAATDEAMKAAFEKQTIGKMSMPQLKSWLQSKNISIGGKKADLVERVEIYFEKK